MTFNYIEILIKLALGLVSLVFVINVTGKGNLAPNSAIDQIQNYVLGGIIGGVIYNSSITILQYAVILIMWTILVLSLKEVKRAVQEQNGQLIVVQNGDENPKYPVITDGVIQSDVLDTLSLTEEWLIDHLNKQGYDNVANIFIAEYDKGQLSVVTYE